MTQSLVFGILLLFFGTLYAQSPSREISKETTEKKYHMYEEGQLVEKSIKIYTVIRQDVKFDTLVDNQIDANRIKTPKEITKTVRIDNDSDDDYDETVKFSYTSNADKTFLVNVNDEEIFSALENSNYLNVKDNVDLSEENLNHMIVITDSNGKVIQLVMEKYESKE